MSSEQQQDWADRRKASKKARKKNTVLTYLLILFAVAFILLVLAAVSQWRINQAAIDNLEETSHSASQTLQNIISERDRLKGEVTVLQGEADSLRTQLGDAQGAAETAAAELETANAIIAALDDLNQLRTLYNQGRISDARALLAELETAAVTEPALTEYVSRCPAEQLEIYNPLEAYQNLRDWLS